MRNRGFTLIELMITLGIIGILVSTAVPSLNRLIQSIRISAVSSQLERAIRLGRREAIVRKSEVKICPGADGQWCSGDDNWALGWLIYADATGDASRQEQDPLIRAQTALSGLTIRYNRGIRLSFNAAGRISQNGSFYICDPTNNVESVRLVMIHTGRLRMERTKDKNLCD